MPQYKSKHLKLLSSFFVLGTLVFNVIAASATVWVVSKGLAVEANPLLDWALQRNPLWFVGVKTALVSTGTYILWRWRSYVLAICGAYALFVIYWSLLLWFWFGVFG